MKKYEYDVKKTMELISDIDKIRKSDLYASDNEGYAKLHSRSNEDLKQLFSNFSVKNKKVLSVLASSDQLFAAYYLGAKSVDTFDLNCLTEYYYYLRKWLIEYNDEYYPDSDRLKTDSSWIRDLLEMVNYSTIREEIAYKYWFLYSSFGIKGAGIFKLIDSKDDVVVDDVLVLKELLRDKELHFTQENISERIDKRKKYDVIILSNILEYSTFDMERLERVRDNLFDILEDDGQIIASHSMNCNIALSELEVFSSKFDCCDFLPLKKDYFISGYCYTKKCC